MEHFDLYIAEYRKYGIIALAVDAGKLGSVNYLDILICNAYSKLKPVIFRAFQNFKGDQFNYQGKIKKAITDVNNYGLEIAIIVSDGLRVQHSAIELVIAKNVKESTKTEVTQLSNQYHIGVRKMHRLMLQKGIQ